MNKIMRKSLCVKAYMSKLYTKTYVKIYMDNFIWKYVSIDI